MGNTQPKNRTGQKQTEQKLENAKKLGILSLSEHALTDLPNDFYTDNDLIQKLRVLDLSKNKLGSTPVQLQQFKELKKLNLDDNLLYTDSIQDVSKLLNLQNLSMSKNHLGKPIPARSTPTAGKNKRTSSTSPGHVQKSSAPSPATTFPQLPASLKQLNISYNALSSIPPQMMSKNLVKLEKLDLSNNQLIIIPDEISNLTNLEELRLDSNKIVSIPSTIGLLKKLKALSLKENDISVPLPRELFVETKLIDLNLHGNSLLTNTIINQWDGFDIFLERRRKVKSKLLSGDPGDTCGLE